MLLSTECLSDRRPALGLWAPGANGSPQSLPGWWWWGGAGHSWSWRPCSADAITVTVQETCDVLQTVPLCFRLAALASEADWVMYVWGNGLAGALPKEAHFACRKTRPHAGDQTRGVGNRGRQGRILFSHESSPAPYVWRASPLVHRA